MEDLKEVISKLRTLDVSSKTEKKQKLTYLSWTWAWDEILKNYPTATYKVIKQDNGLPYVYDELTGYMVFTNVTIENLTHEMWLPVMDGANKSMKAAPYKYTVKDWNTGGTKEKSVEPASMFDINKAIMRCLVKNLAMFGLGLYIYSGEDLPEVVPVDYENELKACKTEQELGAYYKSMPADKKKAFAKLTTELKLELSK